MIINKVRFSSWFWQLNKLIGIVLLALPLSGCEWLDENWGTINNMLANLMKSYPGIYRFLAAFCYVVGIWFIFTGFFKLKRYGEMRTMMMGTQMSISSPLVYIFIGTILFYFPDIVKIMLNTLWGTTSLTKYPEVPKDWKYFTDPVIGLVRIVGYIAFIRGWMLLVRLAQESHQPGTAGKALLHIFGGILAINIVGTINMIAGTLA